jgi:hypothetical protein
LANSIEANLGTSVDLEFWTRETERLLPSPDQTGVPGGFIRKAAAFDTSAGREFQRLEIDLQR